MLIYDSVTLEIYYQVVDLRSVSLSAEVVGQCCCQYMFINVDS